jgi:hypothetical protein
LFSARPDLKARGRSVSAYTLTWRSSDEDTSAFLSAAVKDLELRLVRAAEGLDCALQIFAAHSTMQPRSAMVLYRKIWKTLSIGAVPDGVEVGFENLIECLPGVRFASLANVPMVAIPWMISAIRGFDVVVPLLLPSPLNIEDSSALELARIALPPDGCSIQNHFDWAAFSCHVAMLGGVCVREGGAAAGEFAVDFFASEANMPALVRVLETDDGLDMYQVQ